MEQYNVCMYVQNICIVCAYITFPYNVLEQTHSLFCISETNQAFRLFMVRKRNIGMFNQVYCLVHLVIPNSLSAHNAVLPRKKNIANRLWKRTVSSPIIYLYRV